MDTRQPGFDLARREPVSRSSRVYCFEIVSRSGQLPIPICPFEDFRGTRSLSLSVEKRFRVGFGSEHIPTVTEKWKTRDPRKRERDDLLERRRRNAPSCFADEIKIERTAIRTERLSISESARLYFRNDRLHTRFD